MSFPNEQTSNAWTRKFSDNVEVYDIRYVLAKSRMRVSRGFGNESASEESNFTSFLS